jgi:hypothetical protein
METEGCPSRTERRYATIASVLLVTVLLASLAIAATGLQQNDPTPQANPPTETIGVMERGLFQLGDGIDPTLPGLAAIVGSGVGPDWRDLFNPDGTLRDEYDANGVRVPGGNGIADAIDRFGGRAAVFIGDDVSAGARIDLTVFDLPVGNPGWSRPSTT